EHGALRGGERIAIGRPPRSGHAKREHDVLLGAHPEPAGRWLQRGDIRPPGAALRGVARPRPAIVLVRALWHPCTLLHCEARFPRGWAANAIRPTRGSVSFLRLSTTAACVRPAPAARAVSLGSARVPDGTDERAVEAHELRARGDAELALHADE